MRRLFIAEKPSAAKAIAEGLGRAIRRNGYFECGDDLVSYCIGHLFSQKEPDAYLPNDIPKTKKGKKIWRSADLPIIPDVWKYDKKKETKEQLNILGTLIKQADVIVHAGDVDREGQAIVDQVIEHFKAKVPVKRFCVSAQDPVSITRGLRSLKDNSEFKGWRNAAIGRQRADWLVGMNVTRALTLAAQASGDKSLLVVGRVQSPTLALVVNRDRLIENFVPKDYFLVHATINHEKGNFTAHWTPPKDSDFLDDENRIIKKAVAEKAVQDLTDTTGAISSYSKEPRSIPQPLGLSLSDITLTASNRFGYSADQTLKTVQSLYETHKLCSYPRSDCSYLPEAQKSDASAILSAVASTYPAVASLVENSSVKIHSRIWNDKKITAHHAIVPTMHVGQIDKLSRVEANLYDVIARNYLMQFYPKHEYDATTILIKAVSKSATPDHYLLRATGSVVTVEGWKCVAYAKAPESRKSSADDTNQRLPVVKNADVVGVVEPTLQSRKTAPPKHFTEGTLIKALENIHKYIDNPEYKKLLKEEDGIGTPATRSSIITELKRRHYLDTQGKFLISSDLGRRLVDTLPETVTSPVLTAQYERELLQIQNRQGSVKQFIESQVQYVTEQVANAATLVANNPAPRVTTSSANKNAPTCPECSSALIRRKNTNKGKGFWWGCSGYPNCKNTYSDKRGKPDFKAEGTSTSTKAAKSTKSSKSTKNTRSATSTRSTRSTKSAASEKTPSTTTEHKCQKCDSTLVSRKSVKGTVWYGCSSFPKCKERYFDKDGAPDFN